MRPPNPHAMATLYREHLQTLSTRADEALARGGFEHLVVPSGSVHYQLFDDRDYPYAVNPQFKAWVPLTRMPRSWLVYTPGRKPKVIYYQPADYWHVVPATPSGAPKMATTLSPGETSPFATSEALARCTISSASRISSRR